MRVVQAGEHAIIALVRSLLPSPPPYVLVGPGDDAAVLEPARNQLEVVTTDACVEGIHFDRRFVDPVSIGHRALAANLSDLAAMGAEPRAALLSLGLPDTLSMDELRQVLEGFTTLAASHRLPLVGGNVTRSSGPLFLDITLLGSAKPRKVLTRGGGRPGDELYLTGAVGGAAAGLALLREAARAGSDDGLGASGTVPTPSRPDTPELSAAVDRFLRPEPRIRFGVMVGRNKAASACIDLSDGLGDGVRQLAEASGTGAVVEADLVPLDPALRCPGPLAERATELAFSGGEDYELLLAVPRRAVRKLTAIARHTGLPITRIGALTRQADLLLKGPDGTGPLPAGYMHFRQGAASSP